MKSSSVKKINNIYDTYGSAQKEIGGEGGKKWSSRRMRISFTWDTKGEDNIWGECGIHLHNKGLSSRRFWRWDLRRSSRSRHIFDIFYYFPFAPFTIINCLENIVLSLVFFWEGAAKPRPILGFCNISRGICGEFSKLREINHFPPRTPPLSFVGNSPKMRSQNLNAVAFSGEMKFVVHISLFVRFVGAESFSVSRNFWFRLTRRKRTEKG